MKKFLILFLNFVLVVQISFVGLFWNPQKAQAVGFLTQITVTPSDVTASAHSNYLISFKIATSIPLGGKIIISFPAGFDINDDDDHLDFTDMDLSDDGVDLDLADVASGATWGAAISGQDITFTSDTGTIVVTSIVQVEIGTNATYQVAGDKRIINSPTPASLTYQVTITTKTAADATLDSPTGSIYFQIFDSHSETNIDGIYYLRDDVQTHYQNRGSAGTASDIGSLVRNPPSSAEWRFCGSWVQFYLDENGTYTQTNTLNNIYYHVWWRNENDQGILGYDRTGSYNTTLTELFTISSETAKTKVDNLNLSISKQTLSSPLSIIGNAFYNFTIRIALTSPTLYSAPNQASFVILNIPATDTPENIADFREHGLSGLDPDSDDDGLTDYDELFTYYTNPYDNDTDNDGYNDKYEVDNSMNPNDPQRAPVFGKSLLNKQFNGSVAGDYFGYSVSSIGDQDGDTREDVLIGAPSADPGGKTDAGSVYIYSSSSGDLLKQFDGNVSYDNFGYSVSRIGDQDDPLDGKEDVLIGAYKADPNGSSSGSAYIYSSSTAPGM
ncbi:MAG: hypothetical protein NT135_03195, partial [Candidatus Berkelbacteria bacterium]|nr:hypothetical protein [Candidatus Berkelbacteria bacterium]